MWYFLLQDLDYIVWTGDLVPHDVWNQSKSHNLQIIKEAVKQMTEKFPNVPIFPALGNHESSPVNRYNTNGNNSNTCMSTFL